MVARNIKIRQEDKTAAVDYFNKAKDNYTAMIGMFDKGNYNAASTLAIQCAISAADAACVHEKGIRSVSEDHFDVCDLVNSLPIEGTIEKANLLKRIISKKNLVQYERRNMHMTEAEEIVKLTSKFYQWVVASLKFL